MPTFFVNEERCFVGDDRAEERLLNYLRDTLRLTGTKCGCDEGTCCCCTVILDGEAVRQCLVKLGRMDGKRVTTIEGLSKRRRPASLAVGLRGTQRNPMRFLHLRRHFGIQGAFG